MRLIDADALIDDIDGDLTDSIAEHRAIEKILNAPTIDPQRMKGRWIGYAGTIGAECSECHKWLDVIQGTAEMNYCPNCGADMRGEQDGKNS